MDTLAAVAHSTHRRPLGLCVLTGAVLTIVGCVSQQTYDKTKAEASELAQAVEHARADLQELEQQVSALQASNRNIDRQTLELRTAIQHEVETGPMERQRAEDKLGVLQTQVAHLLQQSRLLGREVSDAKQEGASLQATVTQYKQEIESRASLSPAMPPGPATPAPALNAASSTPATDPSLSPPQPAGTEPASTVKPTVPTRPAKAEPARGDESWTGMIINWVSSLWSWIFP